MSLYTENSRHQTMSLGYFHSVCGLQAALKSTQLKCNGLAFSMIWFTMKMAATVPLVFLITN